MHPGYAPAGYGHAPAQGYAPAGYGHAPAQGAGHGYSPAGQAYVGYTQDHGPGQTQRLEAIACPQCQQPTTALKAYKVITLLVFVWFFAWFRHGTLVACPPCMRKKLGMGLLVNLVPANVLWPLLVLPWTLVQILRSYAGGHSSAARALLRQAG